MPSLICPICRRSCEVKGAAPPFCSERCRTIDLGRWLGGEYRVAGAESPREVDDRPGVGVPPYDGPAYEGEPN